MEDGASAKFGRALPGREDRYFTHRLKIVDIFLLKVTKFSKSLILVTDSHKSQRLLEMTLIGAGLAVTLMCSAVAALFAVITFLRGAHGGNDARLIAQFAAMVREQVDLVRRSGEEQARNLRQELTDNSRGFQETAIKLLGEGLSSQIKGLRENADQQNKAAKDLRDETTSNFHRLGGNVAESLTRLSDHQKERLEKVEKVIATLTEKNERSQEALKQAVEKRLDSIRAESASKLDEMRKTVDEKLHNTLETRLGESFNRVVEHLERVHKGIGEMQSLASDVGNLKNVLSNVRARGTFGEIQLETILEQFLSPEQFLKNAQVKENSQERVEFAIRLPGREGEAEVLLPVDAKFPHGDYERLIAAAENGDADGVLQASRDLETTIRKCAKTIRDKYIVPPRTTDFAILFLPTESLYAEVLRRPGLFQQLQKDYNVTLSGPTTFSALLNALRVGFRSLAIEERSGEIKEILGAVRNEFTKYNEVVDRLSKQLETASNSVKSLGQRTRAMNRALLNVEKLPDEKSNILLGPVFADNLEDAQFQEIMAS